MLWFGSDTSLPLIVGSLVKTGCVALLTPREPGSEIPPCRMREDGESDKLNDENRGHCRVPPVR